MGNWTAAVRVAVILSLASGALPMRAGSAARAQSGDADCFGQAPTILGTSGDDVLRGTGGFDVIAGLGGNDRILGGGGPNFICAGEGDDRVTGGPKLDLIEMEEGADVAHGGAGDDVLLETSQLENDGGPVFAEVGDASDDEFHGGSGDDIISEDGANDLVDGGKGDDVFFGILTLSPMVVDLGTGYVTSARGDVNTLFSVENAYGGIYGDVMRGNEGANVLSGTFGADLVYGEGGSDLLFSSVDGDLLDGGSDAAPDGVMVMIDEAVAAHLGEGVVSSQSAGSTPDRMTGIEDFIASPGEDVVTGSEGANRLYGGGGTDVLDGAEGDDVVVGDGPFRPWFDRAHWWRSDEKKMSGADRLTGSEGRDRLDGGPRRDGCRSGEVLVRCEVTGGPGARSRAPRRAACCRIGGLDAWWSVLLKDPFAQPWLDLAARLR